MGRVHNVTPTASQFRIAPAPRGVAVAALVREAAHDVQKSDVVALAHG